MTAPNGLTLRDYFAAAALPVAYEHLRSEMQSGETLDWVYTGSGGDDRMIAALAYVMADSMLQEREGALYD